MQLKSGTILFGLICLFIICSCDSERKQRYDVLKSLLKNFDKWTALYYKSDREILQSFTFPITTYQLKGFDQVDTYNIDSLISQRDISAWNRKIKNSSPITWDSTKLSGIKIVEKEPAHLEDPIPDPDKTPYPIARQWYHGFASLVYFQQRDLDQQIIGVNYYSWDGEILKDANDGLLSARTQAPDFFEKLSDDLDRRLVARGANHLEETVHPSVKERISEAFRNRDIKIDEVQSSGDGGNGDVDPPPPTTPVLRS